MQGSDVGGLWIVGNVEEMEDEEVLRESYVQQTRCILIKFVQINVMDSIKFVKTD